MSETILTCMSVFNPSGTYNITEFDTGRVRTLFNFLALTTALCTKKKLISENGIVHFTRASL